MLDSRRLLRCTRSRAFRAASRARRGQRFLEDAAALRRVLIQVLGQALSQRDRDMTLDLGVAELAFGLAFELRLQDFDADHSGEALAHVLAGEVGVLLL